MLNLLPQPEKKRLRKEYLFRVATTVNGFLFVTIGIGTLFLLPSLVVLHFQKNTLTEQKLSLEEALASEGGNAPRTFLQETKERMALIEQLRSRPTLHTKIASALEKRASGIAIHSISYSPNVGETGSMSLKGVARNRSALVSFTEALEADEQFGEVQFPVRDLALSSDIPFTVTFEVN